MLHGSGVLWQTARARPPGARFLFDMDAVKNEPAATG